MVLEDSGEQRSPTGTYAGWRRWRRLWRGWIVIPTGIGVSVFTVLQWRRISWNNEPTHQNGSFQITCYRAVPLRAMSRAWGWISSQHVPLSLRCWLYTRYANIYGVNIDEAAHSLEHYSSLCEFFIRPLKEGSRPVAEFDSIVSPADGSVINAGVVNSCNVEQIKGVTYTIKTFLGEPSWNGNAALAAADDDYPKLLSNGSPSNNGILSKSMSMTTARHDKSSANRTTSYFKYSNADNMLQNLEHDGCELLHLDFDNSYRCASKMDVYDSRRLGWLVLYFQFCIKDLLINSFHIGFQIMYGIKSSITLSNGRILKGASFLRSHFSFSSYSSSSSSSSSSSAFENDMKGEPTIERLSATGDSDSDDDSDSGTFEDDSSLQWQAYKGKLLHNPDNELYQFVVYLAPGDYHRFHSPADLKINFRRHFQGELLSVHPKITKWIPELFSLNERAVYVGEWEHGFFSLVAVGATNVGSIKVHSDRELLTNTRRWKHGPHFKDKHLDVEWKKGEEIGEFRMGSTIVLLFEAPKNFSFCTQPGEKIKVGESVTNWRGESSGASTSD